MIDAGTQGKAQERLALLSLIGINAVIADAQRRVLGMTGSGVALADLPKPLIVHDGRLIVRRTADQRRFSEALTRVLHARVGGRSLVRIGSEHFLTLIRDTIDGDPAVVIIVTDRSLDRRICPYCLQQEFELTAREAELAALLATGQLLQEVATALQIRLATARTHLRHIFQKIGVQTQSGLIALLASCAFGRHAPPPRPPAFYSPAQRCE